jgi:hypothetical protein
VESLIHSAKTKAKKVVRGADGLQPGISLAYVEDAVQQRRRIRIYSLQEYKETISNSRSEISS